MPMFPPNPQTPQQLVPLSQTPAPLDLDDIQGDVLIGLQKKAQRLVFFQIANTALFKRALTAVLLPRIVTGAEAHRREERLRNRKVEAVDAGKAPDGLVEMCGLNIAFTHQGLQKLANGLNTGMLPAAFMRPATDIARQCGDPLDGAGQPTQWDPAFPRDAIDGVINIAGSSREVVDETWAKIAVEVERAITEVWRDGAVGDVRPGTFAGREHFGWRDGISQPAVEGLAVPFPGQRCMPAGNFVVGAAGGSPPAAGLEWMANGSYMVFRKLEQDVDAFERFVAEQAANLGMDEGLLAARMMGRWKSGAPLALSPLADDPILGEDPMRNNDFDYADDRFQRRCPYASHVRKTNPRAEPNVPGGNRSIMRQGIPYGSERAADAQGKRGLLFVCYQADIETQFEKQQRDWANVSNFPQGHVRPGGAPGLPSPRANQPVTPGLDPVIGQPGQVGTPSPSAYMMPGVPQPQASGMDEPVPNYPVGTIGSQLPAGAAQTYVTARATLYLFAPSRSAIEMRLSAP